MLLQFLFMDTDNNISTSCFQYPGKPSKLRKLQLQQQHIRVFLSLNAKQISNEISGQILVLIDQLLSRFPNQLAIFLKGYYTIDFINLAKSSINPTQLSIKAQENQSEQLAQEIFLFCQKSLSLLDNNDQRPNQLQQSEQPYVFPFSFVIPKNLPPSLKNLYFGNIVINITYEMIIKNDSRQWMFELISLKKIKQFQSGAKTIGKWEIKNPAEKHQKKDQYLKIKGSEKTQRQLDMMFKNQQNEHKIQFNPLDTSEQLVSKLTINVYQYCFCFVQNYIIEIIACVPTLETVKVVVRIYEKANLDKEVIVEKNKESQNRPINSGKKAKRFLIKNIGISLYGQLTGLRKQILAEKRVVLHQDEIWGYQGQTLIVLSNQLNRSNYNQLFTMRYWLVPEIQIEKGYQKKIFIKKQADLII